MLRPVHCFFPTRNCYVIQGFELNCYCRDWQRIKEWNARTSGDWSSASLKRRQVPSYSLGPAVVRSVVFGVHGHHLKSSTLSLGPVRLGCPRMSSLEEASAGRRRVGVATLTGAEVLGVVRVQGCLTGLKIWTCSELRVYC